MSAPYLWGWLAAGGYVVANILVLMGMVMLLLGVGGAVIILAGAVMQLWRDFQYDRRCAKRYRRYLD